MGKVREERKRVPHVNEPRITHRERRLAGHIKHTKLKLPCQLAKIAS